MKIVSTIARYLAGAIFVVFGLNGFLALHPLSTAPGLGRTIHGRPVRLALPDCNHGGSGHRGGTSAGQPFRAVGAGCSGAGDRQHSLLPRLHGPEWAAARPFRGAPLGINVRRCATCLCQLVSGANERSEQCNLTP